MKGTVAVVVLVLGISIGVWLLQGESPTARPPVPAEPVVPSAGVAAPEQGEVRYPIERVIVAPPDAAAAAAAGQGPAASAPAALLPSPEEAAARVAEWLAGAVPTPLLEVVVGTDFVRRVVATIDNLPREKAVPRLWPVIAAKGLPSVEAGSGGILLRPDNAARYMAHVALAEGVSLDALVAGYKQLYPLFQQAYRELGYPAGNFNDRLVAVLDHLIAAPEATGPLALVQPKVLYLYADPAQESLSAGHKILLRIGPENARRVKLRLAELRRRLAGEP